MMADSQRVKSTVPGSASVSENATTNSLAGTSSIISSNTRTSGASTDKNLHKRPGRTSKKSSSSPGDASIPSYSMVPDEEAVPGAVPVPGLYMGPSGGDIELEDGSYHGDQNDRPLSSLAVASELVEEEEKTNLEQKIHQVLETQLLMHQRNVVFAESIIPIPEASNEKHRNAVDDNMPARGFFARNWRWLLVLLLILVATVSGVAIGVALQNGSSTNPETEPPFTGVTSVPTMSAVVAPSSSPTMSLVEMLKPSIVRNDADLALLNDDTSPQWRAMDWLSTDSIALIENQSPTIILNRYVLAVLYYSTNGNDWGQQVGFLQPTSVCEWNNGDVWGSGTGEGVYCVQQSSVQQIRILNLGLRGTVPWELSLLKTLEFLDLSDNSLTGTLPPELGDLPALKELYIYQSRLIGTLPTEFGKLATLVVLMTQNNDLTGPLPTEIGQMVGLHTAHFARNAFNGTLPTEIGQLSALQIFSVDSNNLSGTLPTELGQLISLSEAWLQDNRYVGTVPIEFAQLSNLSKLTLAKSNLTGTFDDVLCLPQRQWAYLNADCAPDTPNGTTVEIQCSCCNECCTSDGNTCSAMGS